MSLGMVLCSGKLVGSGLHLDLQMLGQKNLTCFPVAGSICLHRLIGFANTHVAHCLSCSLLKRKGVLSSHSPLSSVG